jgi:hypothetical protein
MLKMYKNVCVCRDSIDFILYAFKKYSSGDSIPLKKGDNSEKSYSNFSIGTVYKRIGDLYPYGIYFKSVLIYYLFKLLLKC